MFPKAVAVMTSADVAFDEEFETFALAHDKTLFHDGVTVRGQGLGYIDESRQDAFTGPPNLVDFSTDQEANGNEQINDESNIYEDEVQYIDTFELVQLSHLPNDSTNEEDNMQEEPLTQEPTSFDPTKQYDFEDILEHKGPLKRGDPNYRGSMYEVKILWNDGSTSWEPLKNIPSDWLATYALEHNLLDTKGWKRFSQYLMDEPKSETQATQAIARKPAFSTMATIIADTVFNGLVDVDRAVRHAVMATMDESISDLPGSDPAPFLQLPRDIGDVESMPTAVANGWSKSFVKEVSGILIQRQACKIEDPGPDDSVIPVMAVFRTKLDKDGLLDKLKTRVVFRGDLYEPKDPQDPWNPHASFLTLKLFLAFAAKNGTFPMQVDFLLAYLQAKMRERVFVKFPEAWKKYLPEHLHKWIGRPLLLLRALYGYNYSGKFLYQDQADFLQEEGFTQFMPGFWMKRYQGGYYISYLHYVDDILIDSNHEASKRAFVNKLREHFDLEAKPRADWYLQTRIQQDKDKNITLDQTRYCKSMIQRFLPLLANQQPTRQELRQYESPMKPGITLLKDDLSKDLGEVADLEREFGFRYLELIGCFNWLSYTCYEEIFCTRRLCRFMNLPGRPHFLAALHLLHHFRCHPPKPLIFYHNLEHAPVMQMLEENKVFVRFKKESISKVNHIVFADSSHCDAGEGRSTACELQVYQGGLIDHTSWVPQPVALSTAESENNCYSAAIMKAVYLARCISFMQSGSYGSWNPTIPICVDNSAAITINEAESITRKVRHVESRYWYGRQQVQRGLVKLIKVDGKSEQAADIGTKNVPNKEGKRYLELFEAPYYTN